MRKFKTFKGRLSMPRPLQNEGHPLIVSFWATWCKPCISELNAFHDYYLDLDLEEETGVKVVAISIDDPRTMSKVAPFVAGQAWDYSPSTWTPTPTCVAPWG